MKIYILRHAEAVDAEQVGGNDAARYLTPKGEEATRRAARGLAALEIKPDAVWSSPFARARQTAGITAETMELKCPVEEIRELKSGADPGEITGMLQVRLKDVPVMVVGHNPDLEELVQYLISDTDQARVSLKKGGLAIVDADRPLHQGCGTLVGLLTPKQLTRLGETLDKPGPLRS
jgi:phosphohistidine phosphatase